MPLPGRQRRIAGGNRKIRGALEYRQLARLLGNDRHRLDRGRGRGAAGDREGERPALTPIHSGTAWSTYQVNAQWRVGGGLNFRSEQSANRNPGWMAPAFTTVDLMTEYTFNEKVSLKANVANINNVVYGDSLYTGHYVPGSGRNAQLALHDRVCEIGTIAGKHRDSEHKAHAL